MSYAIIRCTSCKQNIEIFAGPAPMEIHCSHCGANFTLNDDVVTEYYMFTDRHDGKFVVTPFWNGGAMFSLENVSKAEFKLSPMEIKRLIAILVESLPKSL